MSDTESITAEHFDVLIVGAGISGIGGAYHLEDQCPDKTFAVLETQAGFGGTWRTHTYPGIRSDSDLYTFGYRFKPWVDAPIASGEQITKYLTEVLEENDLERHIRYQHRVDTATWSTETSTWTVDVTRLDTGEKVAFSANFLWMCQGYYRHSEGYTPEWDGMDEFSGAIVHPQRWPEDLDYGGSKVVVIGSGATAATLVPALAKDAGHVTMLQRSPTYFVVDRNANELADLLRELEIPDEWTHEIVRRNILLEQRKVAEAAVDFPELVKEELLSRIKEILGEDFDYDTHLNPSYRPWRQRLAFVPDGDLFHAVADERASIVTNEIARFVPEGIETVTGEVLEADIVVTATGFNLSVLGDIDFVVDGETVDFAESVTWHGTMFTGLPNLSWVFGYFRASWTLRADLIADFVCRLLKELDERQATKAVPILNDPDMALLPWVDPEDFNPGYLTRAMHLLPKQGDRDPWRHTQDYWTEKDVLPLADFDDGTLEFS